MSNETSAEASGSDKNCVSVPRFSAPHGDEPLLNRRRGERADAAAAGFHRGAHTNSLHFI